ncbi:DUF202 domain-containing protein [Streptomyces sp. NPDC012623]|uniref:DUF202 domain-containing protein n=1 Tax=unclassified Streptomyces TaxID=2593676 RepID=UPI003684976D
MAAGADGATGAAGEVRGRDPGLQPERTRLAWRRTTLSCTVVAVLAARQAIHGGATPAGLTAAALSALLWLGFLAVAHRRVVALTAARPGVMSRGGAVTAVACTVLLAVCAVPIML